MSRLDSVISQRLITDVGACRLDGMRLSALDLSAVFYPDAGRQHAAHRLHRLSVAQVCIAWLDVDTWFHGTGRRVIGQRSGGLQLRQHDGLLDTDVQDIAAHRT